LPALHSTHDSSLSGK